MVSVKLCPCGQPGIPAQTGYSVSTLATSGFPGGSDGKEFPCDTGDPGSVFGLGRSLEKEMVTYSTILAGEFLGQRSLVAYGPRVHKELDMTERLN